LSKTIIPPEPSDAIDAPRTDAINRVSTDPGNTDAPIDDDDLIDRFDTATAIMREALIESLRTPGGIKIKDKSEKVRLLEKLEHNDLFEPWVADLIAGIRADLQQLESDQ
jgi:hypothetical protein